MKTPEQILDSYKPMSEYPSYYHESQIIDAMQEHAIEFAEWVDITAVRIDKHLWKYRGDCYDNVYTTKQMYEFYIKSIEPITT